MSNTTTQANDHTNFSPHTPAPGRAPSQPRRWLTAIAISALALSPVAVVADSSPAFATTAWEQLGLDIDGEAAGDASGYSVSISDDGTRVAIGAYGNDGNGTTAGHVRVYQWDGATWGQLGADIDGEEAGEQSGGSVSLSGDGTRVAIGAPLNDVGGTSTNAGHVRVYQWDGATWGQLGADIDGEEAGDKSGASVSLTDNGTRVAISAIDNNVGGTRNDAGHVRVYQWDGATWGQLGADIDGEAADDQSGYFVSISGDGTRVGIGAPFNDDVGDKAGHVRVFGWSGTAWDQLGLDIDGEAAEDYSGYSVSLSGDGTRVAIGAPYNDGGGDKAGHVRMFGWSGTAWDQVGADIDGESAGDYSGFSVSISTDGTRVSISAPDNDGTGSQAGHVRVFGQNGTAWDQLGADIDGEAAGDNASNRGGSSVALSGDGTTVAIGAPWNDGASLDPTNNAGHVRIYTVAATITSETASGTPGIFLHITGPVGRSVAGSPVYYGADRVQVTSTYRLTLTPVGGNRPPVTMLAEGTIELNGSFSTSVRLDPLAPGSYDVQFTGTHRNGATLELTSRIVVGPGGEYMLIGDNIPIIR